MEFQILHAFPIQSQPWLDIRVLGIARLRIRITLLDFAQTFLINAGQQGPKGYAKNGALRSAPATLVSQWLGKFEQFMRQFHFVSCNTDSIISRRSCAPASNFLRADSASVVPPEAMTGIVDFAAMLRTSVVDFSCNGAPLKPPS